MSGDSTMIEGLHSHETSNPFLDSSPLKPAPKKSTPHAVPRPSTEVKTSFDNPFFDVRVADPRTKLNANVNALFHRYFAENRTKIDKRLEAAVLNRIMYINDEKLANAIDAFLQNVLTSTAPGSLRSVIDKLTVLMERSGIEKEDVAEFKSDFQELCGLYKKSGNSIKRVLASAERQGNFLYRINRTIRNVVRFVGGLTNSESLQGLTTSLGFVCLIGALINLRWMLESGLLLVAPNRTAEQRASSLADFLLYSAAFIDDLAVGLSAIGQWLHANPAFAAFSIVGLYFAIAAVGAGIAKNAFDLYFYWKMQQDLKEFVFEGNFDYIQYQEQWKERIENYGRVVGTLVRVCEPQFLATFKELDDVLESHGHIFAPGTQKVYTLEQNHVIHRALKGRVKSKIVETSLSLLASSIDMAALVALAAAPATGGAAYAAAAGALMFTTSLMGFTRVWVNDKGAKKMSNVIADGFGDHRQTSLGGLRYRQDIINSGG